jgi:hypothetical protein
MTVRLSPDSDRIADAPAGPFGANSGNHTEYRRCVSEPLLGEAAALAQEIDHEVRRSIRAMKLEE